MADYPYLATNKSIPQLFEKIRTAGKPSKFTNDFLRQMGFTSSNDRGYPPLLKKLGFLTDDGTPTQYYDHLRDESTAKVTLAERIKSLYSDLFTINTSIQSAPESEIKGAISRITGKDETNVSRIYSTFKALCSIADFNNNLQPVKKIENIQSTQKANETSPIPIEGSTSSNEPILRTPSFHYNIQIHLPATTDISVYNAIFKSIRENFS